MLGRTASIAIIACWLFVEQPAFAHARPVALTISRGPLSAALQQFARQSKSEILFDRQLVSGYVSPAVTGTISPEKALRQLLAATPFQARLTSSGAWVVEQRSPAAAEAEEIPAPEILVVGRRSQNVDIRRRENDVQPYRVWSARQVIQAHRDNLDQFFQSRVTANTQPLSPSLLDNGETVSEIDLRGLGTDATLVLLEGRRMPALPSSADPFGSRQSDLNAIPLHAIERVETLTGTAGGIHGFGALGGVVNVILRRDYRGVELHGTAGASSRGDARRIGLEGRLGFTPDDGRTEVMLYLSHARSQPLLVGERGYISLDRRAIFNASPDLYDNLARSGHFGNSINITNLVRGAELVLRPEFGGGSIGADQTSLPVGFEGTADQLAASLTARAGRPDLSLSDAEADSQLGSRARTTAAILNVRRSFGEGIEGFVDAVLLRNRGRHRSFPNTGMLLIFPGAPGNPFNNFVRATFPIPEGNRVRHSRFEMRRFTAGIIASLPLAWRGTAEATFGSVKHSSSASDESYFTDPFSSDLNPFAPWDQFQDSITQQLTQLIEYRMRTKHQEQSLRLSGPLFSTAAGQTNLTLLAERRKETVPRHISLQKFEGSEEAGELETASRSSRTWSFYGEARAPLTGGSTPFLKYAELQLAVRHERLTPSFSRTPTGYEPFDPGERLRHDFAATSYTVGAKTTPLPWLMLRGSYATGRQPPPLESLIDVERVTEDHAFLDPKRGNRFLTSHGLVTRRLGGSPELELVRASTLSFGGVFRPAADHGPKFAIDYSRVKRTGDPYTLNETVVLAHETEWPDRVVREPLTDDDRSLGYTGGRITEIDSRAINGVRRVVESVDGRVEWPLLFLGGQLRPYANATLQLRNSRKGRFDAQVERIGYRTGPLKWRANGGVDWSRGATSLGANLQYYGRYRVTLLDERSPREEIQGSEWIPAQAYLDLYASRRYRLGGASGRDVTIDLGIVNLLDKRPPRETGVLDGGPGYSRYGDPRRRRLELTLSSNF